MSDPSPLPPAGSGDRPLRVAFLTHYFPPEVGATQTRISALAHGLSERGIEVTVHTGFPNYPTGGVKPPYRNRPLLRERDGRLHVVRSLVLPAPNRGFVPRFSNQLAFAVSSLATAAATGAQDVLVVQTPPLFTAGAAIAYARVKRVPLIAHVSDLWPATVVELGALRNPRAVTLAHRLEWAVYRAAAAITVPTRGIARTLEDHPTATGKVHRMPPVVDVERFAALPAPERRGPLRVLYAGTLGPAQGVETLVDAAAAAGPDVVDVTIAGWGSEGQRISDRLAATGTGMTNVRLLGTVAPERVRELFRTADVGVVLLRDRPVLANALPTKLYECMAAGRPVVLSARGEAAELIAELGSGVVVAPEDPAALAGALSELAAADDDRLAGLAAAGRVYVERSASLDASVTRWVEVLAATAGACPLISPSRRP